MAQAFLFKKNIKNYVFVIANLEIEPKDMGSLILIQTLIKICFYFKKSHNFNAVITKLDQNVVLMSHE